MTDMEGVAGVVNAEDYTSPTSRYYEVGRELATMEANAAIEGCLEAGASDILVVDGHGCGAMDWKLLHPAARLLTGRPMGYPFGCSRDVDAALIVGQHAKANTDGGHLCHTGSFDVDERTVNGVTLGELGVNMLFIAYYGVPTVMVSGDVACCNEAHALVPNVATAAVKEGLKRGAAVGLTAEENQAYNGAAIHLGAEEARAMIRRAALDGVQRRTEIASYWLEPPYEMTYVWRPSQGRSGHTATIRAGDLMELLTKPAGR
jgi:D-amino peptidase